ncbi:MAG: NADH-quinone oxidoreductase subunit J [Candidatus Anammoxibacter sp.]
MTIIVSGILAFIVAIIGVLVNIVSFSEAILFYLISSVAVISAVSVILQKNPIYSVISLIVTLVSLSTVFLLLNAQFLAAVQIIVYAGAIMVLFLFVVMLLNLGKDDAGEEGYDKLFIQKKMAVILGGTLFVIFGMVIKSGFYSGKSGNYTAEVINNIGNTELIGKLLFTEYLLPFEITSVLLFAAIIGTIILAKKKIK